MEAIGQGMVANGPMDRRRKSGCAECFALGKCAQSLACNIYDQNLCRKGADVASDTQGSGLGRGSSGAAKDGWKRTRQESMPARVDDVRTRREKKVLGRECDCCRGSPCAKTARA